MVGQTDNSTVVVIIIVTARLTESLMQRSERESADSQDRLGLMSPVG